MLAGGADWVVVAVEAAAELLIAAVFAADLVTLTKQGLGATGEFVELGAGGGDLVAGLGDGVSGGAAVQESAGGEFVFGSAVALFCVVQVAGGGGDGMVVGCAVVFEVGELPTELVDACLAFGVSSLLMVAFGLGGGVGVAGVAVEVFEPVGDLTPRCQRREPPRIPGRFTDLTVPF